MATGSQPRRSDAALAGAVAGGVIGGWLGIACAVLLAAGAGLVLHRRGRNVC